MEINDNFHSLELNGDTPIRGRTASVTSRLTSASDSEVSIAGSEMFSCMLLWLS